MDDDLRDQLDAHETRMERLVNRIFSPLLDRLTTIERKLDRIGQRVTNIETRHIEVDARTSERERLAKDTARAAAQQTERMLVEREWSFGKKVAVVSLTIGAISIAVPISSAILHAIF